MSEYAELHCLSNFSFLRGASHPEELVARAAELGYQALALTDECSLAGVVRAHVAAKEAGLPLIVGSELRFEDGLKLVLLATDRASYGRLSRLISEGRRAAPKGEYHLTRERLLAEAVEGCLLLLTPDYRLAAEALDEQLAWLAEHFAGRAWLAVERHLGPWDGPWLALCEELAGKHGLPLVATGDVHMHRRGRRALQDTLTAIRHGVTLVEAGLRLFPNGERHLRSRDKLAHLYRPEWLAESVAIAARCRFSLDELRYEYPAELVPAGLSASEHLRHLTEEGMARRWPEGVSARVREQIEHELRLIAELQYEPFFLTVHDIVRFARSQDILCQGRGSAANSAVCFCLGITEVDPARMSMLFERFISKERNEPPDIDVDFEHQRREEVIQYIYRKYGRHRAALAATVITYRGRSALREVAKVLGLDETMQQRLSDSASGWGGRRISEEQLADAGFEVDNPLIHKLRVLASELIGFPRHLSQHVGGFVISRGPLAELVPIENAAMAERTVIQWNKDDLEDLGLLKVDVLALGMLSAIRRCLALVSEARGESFGLADIPAEDPAVYRMIQRADTIGVFQIESRAQMAMLPRLKPANFYDLVIEISLVRPGPIQGNMVHPYLRRRQGLEPVSYPSDDVRGVLERTLGVPIFQEQVIQLAMVAAGFSGGEADQLRRAMAAWARKGGLEPFRDKLMQGMAARGYAEQFAEQLFAQMRGFGEYGFPESHAASFALLVYVSAWLKCHYPAQFCCALLNSQPMGFYAPAQLVRDAREHRVEVRPVAVNDSHWSTRMEGNALRLGLHLVKGLSRAAAERIEAARADGSFDSVEAVIKRAALDRRDREALAAADAFQSLAGNRHQARWQVLGVEDARPLFDDAPQQQSLPLLPVPAEGQELVADYASLGLSLRRHPLALLRRRLRQLGAKTSDQLKVLAHGRPAVFGGLVLSRQRPMSGHGVTFLTLEDENGMINVVVWQSLFERYRRAVVGARLLLVKGHLEREGEVLHLIAGHLEDCSELLGLLQTRSRDFH